jgi:hypothetical protein
MMREAFALAGKTLIRHATTPGRAARGRKVGFYTRAKEVVKLIYNRVALNAFPSR